MRRTISLICVVLLFFVSCLQGKQQEKNRAEEISRWPSLTEAIDRVYADLAPHKTGGINTVIYKGEVLHLKGYGAANREFDVQWTADTKYLMGSVTKSMVASAVLKLVDQGLIAIDDPLHDYLPDFPELDWPLTIRHLLSMTSGLWNDDALLPLSGVTGSVSLDTLYMISKSQQALDFPPGSNFRYTCTNYRLLGRIITQLSDSEDFSEAMNKLLFNPLAMDSSSAPPDYWVVQDNQALTYWTMPNADLPTMMLDIHSPISGDGGVRTSMNDFIRWLLYMREDIEEAESRWQRLDQVVHLANGRESLYRLGICRFAHRGLYGIGHGGFTGTQYLFFPEIDLIIAFFHNDIGTFDHLGFIRTLIDAFLFSDEYDYREGTRHSDTDKIGGVRPDPISIAELDRFDGLYVDSESGLILELRKFPPGWLGASYKGSEFYGLKTDDGTVLRTSLEIGAPSIELMVELSETGLLPAVDLKEIHWEKARRFTRVEPMDAYEKSAYNIEGFYYSKALDVFYSVRFEDKQYILRIGSGAGPAQKFRLTKLHNDVYEAHAVGASSVAQGLELERFSVKFDLCDDDHSASLHIITEGAQGLSFKKVSGKNGE